jgi:hypothetical protein
MRVRRSVAFVGLAAFVSLMGCNLIMDLGRFSEAVSASDAGDAGGAPTTGTDAAPGPFDCLNLPNETLDPGAVTLHLTITNVTGTTETAHQIDGGSDLDQVVYTPSPGVAMVGCAPLDPFCANPVTPSEVTDDAGVVTFSLTGAFGGFFHGTSTGVVPFSFFPGQWLTGVTEATDFSSSLTPSDEGLLNLSLGNAVNLDAGSGLGEVFMIVYDCFDHSVAGVKFDLSRSGSDTLPFYITSGVPSTTAGVTDSEGVGGALNMPEGSLRATATFAATNLVLGSVTVYVHAGELTYGWIRMRVH